VNTLAPKTGSGESVIQYTVVEGKQITNGIIAEGADGGQKLTYTSHTVSAGTPSNKMLVS